MSGSAAAATSSTTINECVPTIIAAALLELDEGNIVAPLVTDVPFSGPGLTHQTPFIARITSDTDDSLAYQSMESSGSDETSPSTCEVGVHGAYIQLKDIAAVTSNSDLAALAGQLIGQCLVVRRDLDLITLFTSITASTGSTTTAAMAPSDLYTAYGTLRKRHAPLPYHLVLHPMQIWSTYHLINLFDNSADAINNGGGVGTVGEDFARYGFAGMAMGFTLWADANVVLTTATGSGAAFSRAVMKNVRKRDFQIEIEREATEVADKIVGTEIRGEAILRNKHGVEMIFPSFVAV